MSDPTIEEKTPTEILPENKPKPPYYDDVMAKLRNGFNLERESAEKIFKVGQEFVDLLSEGIIFSNRGDIFEGRLKELFELFITADPIELILLTHAENFYNLPDPNFNVLIRKIKFTENRSLRWPLGTREIFVLKPECFNSIFGISEYKSEWIVKTHLYGTIRDPNLLYSERIWKTLKLSPMKTIFPKLIENIAKRFDINLPENCSKFIMHEFIARECLVRGLFAN